MYDYYRNILFELNNGNGLIEDNDEEIKISYFYIF